MGKPFAYGLGTGMMGIGGCVMASGNEFGFILGGIGLFMVMRSTIWSK